MIRTLRRWFVKEPRRELVQTLGDAPIPSFQPAVLEILRRLRDPRADARQIGQALCADPGLSVRVLRVANSPASGLRRKVDNVSHAATLLGRVGLEGIVLGVAVQDLMPGSRREQSAFWRTSARRAAAARAIAEHVEPARAPLCFAGGLLQDLAIPLLVKARPEYRELMSGVKNTEELAANEERQFGWDHAQVAGWLCEAWEFPDALKQAIEGHHGAAEAPIAVRVVSLVDQHMDDDPEPVIEAARDRFDVCSDVVRAALTRSREQGDELARALISR